MVGREAVPGSELVPVLTKTSWRAVVVIGPSSCW